MSKNYIAFAVVAAALLVSSPVALCAPTPCTGAMSGVVAGDIVVPPGATCVLKDIAVSGNVNVQAGGSLVISSVSGNTTIRGSVKGDECLSIGVDGSTSNRVVIGGDLQITHCTDRSFISGEPASLAVPSVLIGGDFKCSNNTGLCAVVGSVIAGNFACSANADACVVGGSGIGGNATLNNNGEIVVGNNAIAGNLKCGGNGAATSFGNAVAGTISGQC